MKKLKPINTTQILSRKIRGYAFSGGTYEERIAYRNKEFEAIQKDRLLLTDTDFRKKYEQYIY